jgi:hypothetical protein
MRYLWRNTAGGGQKMIMFFILFLPGEGGQDATHQGAAAQV